MIDWKKINFTEIFLYNLIIIQFLLEKKVHVGNIWREQRNIKNIS